MSEGKKGDHYHAGYKKKRNKKRQASSPLYDNRSHEVSSDNNRLTKEQSRKCKKVLDNTNTRSNSGYVYDLNFVYPNMSFVQQASSFGPVSQPMPQTQPMFGHGSPPAQYNNTFAYQPPLPPPPWAHELLEDMKQIKAKMQSIDTTDRACQVN